MTESSPDMNLNLNYWKISGFNLIICPRLRNGHRYYTFIGFKEALKNLKSLTKFFLFYFFNYAKFDLADDINTKIEK